MFLLGQAVASLAILPVVYGQGFPSASGSTTPLSCPASEGQSYIAASGATFRVECGLDHAGGDIGSATVVSLEQCVQKCDAMPGCVDVSLSGVACYMKGSIGRNMTSTNLLGARLVVPAVVADVDCPDDNGTVYTADSGATFAIECGIDHAGGDIGSVSVPTFTQCIAICDDISSCVDVSLSGSACYLKSSVGQALPNVNIFGARLLSRAAPSSRTSSASPASSAASSPRASVSVSLSCPGSNGTVYTAPSGDPYVIECGIDHPGGDMGSEKVRSLEECIASCDAELSCVDVSLSGAACYQKRDLSPGVLAPGILGARLVTATNEAPTPTPTTISSVATETPTATSSSSPYLSCPGSDTSVYTAGNGENFQVECDIDHPGGELSMVQMSGSSRSWLTNCVEVCANSTGCVDVALSGSACYLKSQLRAASSVEGIYGAKLLTTVNTTLPPTLRPVSPAFVGDFEYLACYNDTADSRSLNSAFMFGSDTARMTVERCAAFCTNHTYLGVENGQECFCGNVIASTAIEQGPEACSVACAGNVTELCGGGGAISIYQRREAASQPVASSTPISPPYPIISGNTTMSNSTMPTGGTATISGFPLATGTNSSAFGGNVTVMSLARRQLLGHKQSKHGREILRFAY